AGRHARKQAAERLGAGIGAVRNRVRAYREGGMAALRPKNRNASQANRPAMRRDRSAGDAEAPRRRVEEPELGNALMREVAEAFASSRGRYGYRRVRAVLRTRVSEKALRRIMAEDGPTAHVPERRGYGSYEGETTPAPGDLADRDFTAEMPNEKWLTDITEIKARDGKVYLSPPIDCYDGKIVAYTAGPGPNAELANRMLVKAVETLPEGARPLVHSDRGCHCRRPGWLALMDRYGPARSTGAKGRSPDDATAEGFLGRMRTEPVYPGHWGEHTRDGVLVPIDDCIRWHDHERIKRSIGWMSPVQIPSKPGNGCVIISKKTSAAPLSHLSHIHVDKAQYYIQV
ncbi:MAG: IS3 family transposase, partial [Bifidobacterium sp.]